MIDSAGGAWYILNHPPPEGAESPAKKFSEMGKKLLDRGEWLWYINQAVAEKAACTLKIEQ